MRRITVSVVGLSFVMAFIGCGDSVKLVPAEGTIYINGKPAGNISMQFMPDVLSKTTGPTSYAVSDAEGKFRLKTFDGKDGAVAGTHIIVLADMQEERAAQGAPQKNTNRLDPRYAIADPKNGLRTEIDGVKPIELKVNGPIRR